MRAITITFIVITSILTHLAFKRPELHNRWIFNPYSILTKKQYYRFISSGFIHANYFHLIINMIALFYFGKTIEYITSMDNFIGAKLFYTTLYLGGIASANIPSYFKYKNLPRYNSLGASGGVASVLFGSILYRPTVPLFNISFLPAFLLGIIYLIYTFLQGRRMSDNVNHDAHLVGAVFGILFTVAHNPDVVQGFLEQIGQFTLF